MKLAELVAVVAPDDHRFWVEALPCGRYAVDLSWQDAYDTAKRWIEREGIERVRVETMGGTEVVRYERDDSVG